MGSYGAYLLNNDHINKAKSLNFLTQGFNFLTIELMLLEKERPHIQLI